MRILAGVFVFAHIVLAALVFYKATRRRQLFALGPMLAVALLLYVSLPICLSLPHDEVQINGAMVPITSDVLGLAGFLGLLFAIAIAMLPTSRMVISPADTAWARLLFTALAVLNLSTLVGFLLSFDLQHALLAMASGQGAQYRELAYNSLVHSDTGFGYAPKVLQIALFGYLWSTGTVRKGYLIFATLPVLLLDILSLGRHIVASFLIVAFFTVELSKFRRRLYILAPMLLVGLFFSRVLIFSATDDSYFDWSQTAFSASVTGVEVFGEFFNTFGTFLMVSSIDSAQLTFGEILNLFMTQGILPPGAGGLFYAATDAQFPLFRVSELIRSTYGPHPAHLSMVDVFTFGVFSVFGFAIYFATAFWACRSRKPIASIVYFYLLAMFYLPFRGSLTLNALRFFWLLLLLVLARAFGRVVASRRRAIILSC